MKVSMSWANITKEAKANVNDALNSGWISRRKWIPKFEKEFSVLHRGKYGIFVNSGTDALRIALLTLKEIYQWQTGDEVIIPGLTFVATANAVLQSGLNPRFADVQKETGNIEPKAIAKLVTPMTRAVLAVHLFGLPANMPAVMQIAKKTGLKVIEDSCETVGVSVLSSDMACFSFYMAHHIQCGVGGMIVTNNPQYERVARSYMNHGRIDDGTRYKFGRIGYSSRATEMEAALGCAGISQLKKNLKIRRKLAEQYSWLLADTIDNSIQIPPLHCSHTWMFYPILLLKGKRNSLLNYLREHQIECREAMPLINQPCYAGMYKKGSCPNAENWTKNGVLLPIHPLLKEKEILHVTQNIRQWLWNTVGRGAFN